MKNEINNEESVYGKQWNELHGGYFSDPIVAAPLVRQVKELAEKSEADTIIDLGGGVGSLLSLLRNEGVESTVSLVNLDASDAQLGAVTQEGFSCIHGFVDSFSRREVNPEDGHFLFMMRSVLHYFGKDGLRRVLRHMLTQTKPGEFFVHQTASFRRQDDADCMNELYKIMRTQKWYPTVDFLCECLRDEGWQVLEVLPALPLPLTNDELMHRYNLSQPDLLRISEKFSHLPPAPEDVFKKTDDGFCAFLHYSIYVCTPATSGE